MMDVSGTEFLLPFATILAIVLGPLLAVQVEKWIETSRSRKQRKYEIFRDLLRTRGLRLDAVHVSALNLVEIEFYDDSTVRTKFGEYIKHLNSPMPPVTEQDRYFNERNDLFMDLLHSIGKSLKFSFDKLELGRLSYVPQGWEDDHVTQRRNAALLTEVLSGERAIPIAPHTSVGGPFPAPPKD